VTSRPSVVQTVVTVQKKKGIDKGARKEKKAEKGAFRHRCLEKEWTTHSKNWGNSEEISCKPLSPTHERTEKAAKKGDPIRLPGTLKDESKTGTWTEYLRQAEKIKIGNSQRTVLLRRGEITTEKTRKGGLSSFKEPPSLWAPGREAHITPMVTHNSKENNLEKGSDTSRAQKGRERKKNLQQHRRLQIEGVNHQKNEISP